MTFDECVKLHRVVRVWLLRRMYHGGGLRDGDEDVPARQGRLGPRTQVQPDHLSWEDVMTSQLQKRYFTEMCSGCKAGSYARLIAFCITQRLAHGHRFSPISCSTQSPSNLCQKSCLSLEDAFGSRREDVEMWRSRSLFQPWTPVISQLIHKINA